MILNTVPKTKEAYNLLHEGALALADIEQNGIRIDVDYCERQTKHLERRMKHLNNKILNSEEGQEWRKLYGRKLNMNSDKQLGVLLFDHLGYKAIDKTETGLPSVKEESLEKVGSPIAKDVIYYRRLRKTKNSFLGNFLKEQVEGWLRPFFHLNTVITFRSSSSNINFQNIPNRIEEIKKITRLAVIPRDGRFLGGLDYGGIEVHGAAWYHQDPTMLKYLHDPGSDMHRDTAMDCFLLGQNQVTKQIRYNAKNKFVFPEFYGDWYKSCAKALWDAAAFLVLPDGRPLKDHLAEQRLTSLAKFEKHIQGVEDRFWQERFPQYTKWKEEWIAQYEKQGYFDTLTGFRCSGIMGPNDIVNYPVQGVAFHCLLWSLIQLNKLMKEEKWESTLIGQIHDEIVPDIVPGELNMFMSNADRIMTQDIKEHWPWIITPIEIEAEVTPINQPWYYKDQIHHHACTCGSDWMWHEKLENGAEMGVCPICGDNDAPH